MPPRVPPTRRHRTEDASPAVPRDIAMPIQIQQRQATATAVVPALYGALDNQLDPGAVAGITLGAVAGFMLLLWVVYACLNFGNAPEHAESSVTGSVVVERKSRHSHRHSHHNHRRSRGEATVEVRRTTRVPAAVIVEESRRPVSRGPPPPRVVPMAMTASDDEDEVVVIEEHSPPPRRRASRARSVERRSSRRSYGS